MNTDSELVQVSNCLSGDKYISSKQFSPPTEAGYRVPENSVIFMHATTMYQFDKIDEDKERFAMKLKNEKWKVFDGIKGIEHEFTGRIIGGDVPLVFRVTNGDHQLILTQVS